MRIQYIGHSCFRLVTKEDVSIVIDPYDNSIGLTPVNETADIVLITHHHYDHDYTQGVHGDYTLIDGPGEWDVRGVKIRGFELDHDDKGGALRGKVTAYRIATDGLSILHMGDVGTMPPDSFFEAVKPVDILMIPVGGTYTVDAKEAFAIVERIAPRFVIPMHFKTTRLTLDIAPVTDFVNLSKNVYDIVRQGDVFEAQNGDLKKRGRVILMENSF